MRSLRVLFVVGLLVVGIGAILVATGVLPPSSGTTANQYITAAAARRDVTQSVVASGSVTAASVYDLRFGVASQPGGASSSSNSNASANAPTWPVTSLAVKVGDIVKAGDVLAVADPTNAQLQLTIAKANLAASQSKLSDDRSAPTAATKASASDTLHQAQLQLTQAQSNYSHTKSQNAISLSQAKSALSSAKSRLAADKKAGAPAQTISADTTAVAQAQDNVTSTQARVAASNAQASNQVASAQLGLTSAQHNYTTRIAKATAAQIASDEAGVASAQSNVDAAQTAVDNASIKAPIAGRISAVNIVAGATAPSGTAIELQSSAMAVTAAFSESDVPNLKVGQAAELTIKAVGTDPVAGTVSTIAESAASASGGGVVSYDVTVAITTPPATLRVGMSAQVSVTIAQSANVIAVPAAAILGSSGNYGVDVLDSAGKVESVAVDVGLITSSYVEVKSGLAEGQVVVIGTSASRAGSTTTGGGLFGGGAIPVTGGNGRFNGRPGTVTNP